MSLIPNFIEIEINDNKKKIKSQCDLCSYVRFRYFCRMVHFRQTGHPRKNVLLVAMIIVNQP